MTTTRPSADGVRLLPAEEEADAGGLRLLPAEEEGDVGGYFLLKKRVISEATLAAARSFLARLRSLDC